MAKNKKLALVIALIIFSLFLPGCSGRAGDSSDLINAINRGDLARVNRLLKSGVDANTVNSQGKSALTMAIEMNLGDIALSLLKYGAAVKPGSDLCSALENGADKTAIALIEHGADPHISCSSLEVKGIADVNVIAISLAEKAPFIISLEDCSTGVIKAIIKRLGRESLRSINPEDILSAVSKYRFDDKKCAQTADLVFATDLGLGFCDETIVFIEESPGYVHGFIDLDGDGKKERIDGGARYCGSCGCSWFILKAADGFWNEIDSIDCGYGNLRSSSRIVNGFKVLCSGNIPRYHWSNSKENGKEAGYIE